MFARLGQPQPAQGAQAQGADMVAADFCDLGNLVDGKVLGLARQEKLFGYRGHIGLF